MFGCECGAQFETPDVYHDRHGFDLGPSEDWDVCPACGSEEIKELEQCERCEGYTSITEGGLCIECAEKVQEKSKLWAWTVLGDFEDAGAKELEYMRDVILYEIDYHIDSHTEKSQRKAS